MSKTRTITTVVAGALIGTLTLVGTSPIKNLVNKVRISKTTKTTPVNKKDEDDLFI